MVSDLNSRKGGGGGGEVVQGVNDVSEPAKTHLFVCGVVAKTAENNNVQRENAAYHFGNIN